MLRKRPRVTARVVLGVGPGILAGLFLGERIEGIGAAGAADVRLLQMAIPPYIMVSLVHGFGSLTREQAVRVVPRLAAITPVFRGVGLTRVLSPWICLDNRLAGYDVGGAGERRPYGAGLACGRRPRRGVACDAR